MIHQARENPDGLLPFTFRPVLSSTRPTFREVFGAHVDYVWRTVRHMGVPRSDVPDVVQEVFIVVHRRLPDWEPRHPIRTWLYTICRHQARDRGMRAHVRRERTTDALPEVALVSTPHDELAATRALEQLHAALSGIDREQQEVFLMYELEGLSMEDIAQAMGCPIKTAYSRLRLARAHLARALAPTHEDVSGV